MFTAGQKVRIRPFQRMKSGRIDDGGLTLAGFKAGDVVTIEGPVFGDLVHLAEGGTTYFRYRFEALPDEPEKASGFAAVVPPVPPPFAKGDKVKVVRHDTYLANHGYPVGSVGTVAKFGKAHRGSSDYVWLQGPNGEEIGGTGPSCFELVTAQRKPKDETIYIAGSPQRVVTSPGDFNDGQEVAIYQFVRYGTVKKVTTASVA